jgi:KDO2-lipid IV(A) lauroyltransferase
MATTTEPADATRSPADATRPSVPTTRSAAPASATDRGTAWQRARVRLVAAGAWVVCHLPERFVLRIADLAGDLAYRRAGERRALARANLARVAAWAVGTGTGSPRLRAAATDARALEGLVRSAFRHHARYWVELIRAPRMTAAYIRERVDMSDTGPLADALAAGGPIVFVGMHLGAIELPAFYAGGVAGRRVTAPMETVDDPALQRWFADTRGSVGVNIVGLREARRELIAAIRRGDLIGVVADRDLTGGGIPTELFGHPAPLPAGPALLVLETDAPAYAVVVRRTGDGRYAARVEPLETPREGSRRERVEAFIAAEARVFERVVVDAPDQWWAVFYPIWPDLAEAAA